MLHLCRAPPFPLSHSALWSMFLNHDPVSLVVPTFLANSFPILSHGRFRVNFSPHASLHLGVTFVLELFLIAHPRSCVVILSSLLLLITPFSECSLGSGYVFWEGPSIAPLHLEISSRSSFFTRIASFMLMGSPSGPFFIAACHLDFSPLCPFYSFYLLGAS